MMDPQQASDDALQKCDTLIKLLKKKKTERVWAAEERGAIKATCLTWFNNQRSYIQAGEVELREADAIYQDILKSSAQAASRAGYKSRLKQLRTELLDIRSAQMVAPTPALATTMLLQASLAWLAIQKCRMFSLDGGANASLVQKGMHPWQQL